MSSRGDVRPGRRRSRASPTEDEAIRIANDTPYGLAAYFFSRDVGRVWRVAEGARVRHRRHQHGLHLDRGRAVRRHEGVRASAARARSTASTSGSSSSTSPSAGSRPRRDRRAARLPRPHRQAPGARPPLRRGGHRAPEVAPGQPDRLVHRGRRRALHGRQPLGLPGRRRSRGAAEEAPGRPGAGRSSWPRSSRSSTRSRTASSSPSRSRRSSEARRARSRSSPAASQGIGHAIATGLAAEGARIVDRRPAARRGGGRRTSPTASG